MLPHDSFTLYHVSEVFGGSFIHIPQISEKPTINIDIS